MNKTATNLKKNEKAPVTKKEEKTKKSDAKNDSKANDKKAAKSLQMRKITPKQREGDRLLLFGELIIELELLKKTPELNPKIL